MLTVTVPEAPDGTFEVVIVQVRDAQDTVTMGGGVVTFTEAVALLVVSCTLVAVTV